MKNIVNINRQKIFLTTAVILALLISELLLIRFGMLGTKIEREYVNFTNVNLYEVDEIKQNIKPKYNYLNTLSLFLVNITEETTGEIELKLTDDSGKVFFNNSFSVSDIEVGRFHEFPIKKFLEPNKKYILYINYIGKVPDFGKPKIYVTSKGNLQETGECMSNNKEMKENIAICYSYRQIPYAVGLVMAIVLFVLVIIFLV